MCPASSQDVDLQRSIQVGVASSSEPAIIISSLLSAIVSLGSKDSEQNPSQIIVSPDYDWILSCFTRLLHSIRAVKNSVLDFPHATCLVMSSKTLCNVLSQVNFAPYEILNVSRTSVLLSQVIVVLFNLGSKHVPAVEKSLCFFLLDLVKLCRNSHIILNAIDENLIPFLFEVTKYYNRICDFGADLKVCLRSLTLMR